MADDWVRFANQQIMIKCFMNIASLVDDKPIQREQVTELASLKCKANPVYLTDPMERIRPFPVAIQPLEGPTRLSMDCI